MTNHEKEERTRLQDPANQSTEDTSYTYHWNYEAQAEFDSRTQKHGKRGAAVYALILATVFLLCVALLAGMLVWYQSKLPTETASGVDLSTQISRASAKIRPSTVLITGASATTNYYGTGFFVTAEGHIVTNYHVVEKANAIEVTLYDGRVLDATMIGYQEIDDIAVLKIEGRGFLPLQIGDSSAIDIGDVVVAVGNPGGKEVPWTTTHGIISATNRLVSVSNDSSTNSVRMIQTDASLNTGNSGGPLCDISGAVVGIVTRTLSNYNDINFALPINEAMHTVRAIMEGKLDGFTSSLIVTSRPTVGVTVLQVQKGDTYTINDVSQTAICDGLLIKSVLDGGPSEGILEAGDIIFRLNGKDTKTLSSFQGMLYTFKVGQKVPVEVMRNGEAVVLEITLGVMKS